MLRGQHKKYDKLKGRFFASNKLLSYWAKYKEIQQIIVFFLKFKNSVRNGHCYYSPYVPKHLVTPPLLKDVREILWLFMYAMWLCVPDVVFTLYKLSCDKARFIEKGYAYRSDLVRNTNKKIKCMHREVFCRWKAHCEQQRKGIRKWRTPTDTHLERRWKATKPRGSDRSH